MLAAGANFSLQLKWSRKPMAAGSQHIPGNLAVRQTATTSLKSRFVPQMADRCCRLLLSAALALSLRLIIVPIWERGTLSYVACAWWHALGFGGWREEGGAVVSELKLWCAAGRCDDLYNVWLHEPATGDFKWKCANPHKGVFRYYVSKKHVCFMLRLMC